MVKAKLRRTSRPSLPKSRPAYGIAALVAACVVLFVAVRCVYLDADAPSKVEGRQSRELFSEPPAKSHEARNYALFGSFRVREADDYQFWRVQSPVWVYPLAVFFDVFGVDYPQLRIFSTLYAAFGLTVLLVMASQLMSGFALAFVGFTVAVDAVYFHTSRVGLIEPAMSAWLGVSMLALMRAERNPNWLVLAFTAFGLAFFTKQGALFALPVVLLGAGLQLSRLDRSDPAQRRTLKRVLAAGVAVAVFAAAYIALTDYWRTLTHNVGELIVGVEGRRTQLRTQYQGVSGMLYRFTEGARVSAFLTSIPITGPLACLTLLGFGLHSIRHRRWPEYRHLIVLGWFGCALVALGVIAKWELRFWTVAVLPAALLSGLALDRVRGALAARSNRVLAAFPTFVVLLGVVAWNVRGHKQLLGDPQYSIRDAASKIREHIGDQRAAIVGYSSPSVVLGTPYENYYVKMWFNSAPERFAALGITHCLFRWGHDETQKILRRTHVDLVPALQRQLRVKAYDENLGLYTINWSRKRHQERAPHEGFARGYALQQQGNFDEAIIEYREFLERHPNHAQAHFNLGHALMRAQACTEAIAEFEKVLRLEPRKAEAHLHLATCSRALGNLPDAQYHQASWDRSRQQKSPLSAMP